MWNDKINLKKRKWRGLYNINEDHLSWKKDDCIDIAHFPLEFRNIWLFLSKKVYIVFEKGK